MTPQTARAMAEAGEAAKGTPEEIRKAFLQKRYSVAGIDLHPMTIGILWILEELAHPLLAGETATIQVQDIGRALLAFADPERAYEALSNGADAYNREAFALLSSLPPSAVIEAIKLIPQILLEGLATLPGAGGGNPPPAPAP